MRSPRNTRRRWALVAVLITATGSAAAMEPGLPVLPDAQPTVLQIEEAVELLQQDPNMGTERKVRALKWKSDKKRPAADNKDPGWLQWLQELFSWIAGSARMIVWVLAAVLAAFIAIYLMRLLRSRAAVARKQSFIAPSHVRDLDIRPESLPDDIGAAALQLWQGGEQRRAMALLYRGLLSRMVHVHRVPVRDSTTEGESMALARGCLPAAAGEFATKLVTTWQRAVYGELIPGTDQVRALCADFSPALDARPTTEVAAR